MSLFRLIIVASFVACTVGCGQTSPSSAKNAANATDDSHFSLTINFGDSEKSEIKAEVTSREALTVLDLLVAASQQEDFKITYTGKGETAFVESINGVVGGENGKNWWIYYVNNNLAKRGSGVYQLNPGDSVQWSLGKYELDSESPSGDQSQ